MILEGPQLELSIRQLWPKLCEHPRGVEVDATVPDQGHTGKQRRGYWWLLGHWLRLNPMRGVDKDALHNWVCCTHFGHIEREFPDGRIDWIPLRTTTRRWDEDAKKHKRKQLPLDSYVQLIEFVYRTAAEGNVVLPDLTPEYKRELVDESFGSKT